MDKDRKTIFTRTLHTAKDRVLQLLVWFLGFMVCATFVSRAADSKTTAIVQVETPKSSVLVKTIPIDGVITSAEAEKITSSGGAVITNMAVANGDNVEEGDLLYSYDISDAVWEKKDLEITIRSLQLELEQIKKLHAEKEEKVKRKVEDKKIVEDDYEIEMEMLYEQLRMARISLQKYDGVRRSEYDDTEYTESEYQRLKSDYKTAKLSYQKLNQQKEKELLELERNLDDLKTLSEDDTEVQLKTLQIEKARLEAGKISAVIADGGNVYAPCGGRIDALNAEEGSTLPGGTVMAILNPMRLEFRGSVAIEQKKVIQMTDRVVIKPYDCNQEIRNLAIKEIVPQKEAPQMYDIVIPIESAECKPGSVAKAEIQQTSQTYRHTVPIQALFFEGKQAYVLAVEERETTLGTKWVTRRADVTVEEKNEERAAIMGGLRGDENLVVYSDRPVSPGARVRPEVG